jgi:cytochrome c oxidase subunit IV
MSHGAKAASNQASSVRTYSRCLLALLLLSALALGGAFVHLGAFTLPAALVVAGVKATLVAAYFMHLIDQPPSHRIAAVSGLLLLSILIALAAGDIATRN